LGNTVNSTIAMKKDKPQANNVSSLRYGMFVPLALMIASMVSCCFSYSNAKQSIADDLNEAMLALANENSELWTRQDTIVALRQMHETTHKPMIYQVSDVNFRNSALKDEVYFTIALVDRKNAAPKIQGNKIVSDSIMLVPERACDGLAVQVQGFADCSMASIFAASDQTLPGVLFTLSVISMASMLVWRRKEHCHLTVDSVLLNPTVPTLDEIKLTPMQRQLTQMLLDSPERKVDKTTLCTALWGNKSNAEESLYTLIRRTKTALADVNIEIICNRGDSYELRINT